MVLSFHFWLNSNNVNLITTLKQINERFWNLHGRKSYQLNDALLFFWKKIFWHWPTSLFVQIPPTTSKWIFLPSYCFRGWSLRMQTKKIRSKKTHFILIMIKEGTSSWASSVSFIFLFNETRLKVRYIKYYKVVHYCFRTKQDSLFRYIEFGIMLDRKQKVNLNMYLFNFSNGL